MLAAAQSGSGFQLSLAGLLGVTASGVEGVEMNLLGLTFGVDPFRAALKLPLVGRVVFSAPMPGDRLHLPQKSASAE